jgi:hypothetical protein
MKLNMYTKEDLSSWDGFTHPSWISYFHTLTAPSLLADINLWLDRLTDANARMASRWQPAESAAAIASCVLCVNLDDGVGCLHVSCTHNVELC